MRFSFLLALITVSCASVSSDQKLENPLFAKKEEMASALMTYKPMGLTGTWEGVMQHPPTTSRIILRLIEEAPSDSLMTDKQRDWDLGFVVTGILFKSIRERRDPSDSCKLAQDHQVPISGRSFGKRANLTGVAYYATTGTVYKTTSIALDPIPNAPNKLKATIAYLLSSSGFSERVEMELTRK